jgi:hypothetical protein
MSEKYIEEFLQYYTKCLLIEIYLLGSLPFSSLLCMLHVTMVACKKSVLVHLRIYIRWGIWLCMYEGSGVAVNGIQITLILYSHLECDIVLVRMCFG